MGTPPSLKMRIDPQTNKIRGKWILWGALKLFVDEKVYKRREVPCLGIVEYNINGLLYKEIKRLVAKEAVERLDFFD